MCRHATQQLPPEPDSAFAAREFLRDCFTEWGLHEMIEDSQLALSELVTNAVLHGGTPLTVSLSCGEGVVEIAVFDGNPVLPAIRPHRENLAADLDHAAAAQAAYVHELEDRDPRLNVGPAGTVAGGRGLLIIDAIAAVWGVSPLSDGKAVWVRSPTPEGWDQSNCPCDGDDDGSFPLASGHHVVRHDQAG